jgi:hypothetical protein
MSSIPILNGFVASFLKEVCVPLLGSLDLLGLPLSISNGTC